MIAQFERFEIELTLEQAEVAAHPGDCTKDVEWLGKVPAVASQLAALDPQAVRDELREYGAWDSAELADDTANLQRILWIAAGQIHEDDRRAGQ